MGKNPKRRRGANIPAMIENIKDEDGKIDPVLLEALIEQVKGMLDQLPEDERERVCREIREHCGGDVDLTPLKP